MSRRLRLWLLVAGLCLPSLLWAAGFSFGGGGFSLGGGSMEEEDSGIDLGRVFDAVKNANQSVGDVSQQEEILIGKEAASVLLGAAPAVDDRPLQLYVNKVGRWLAAHSERPALDWHFAVLDTENINAFAAPGGYIFLTKGLLDRLASEAELAAVLAHEMAHVLKRHHLTALQKNARMGLVGNIVSLTTQTEYRQALDLVISGTRELYARGLDKDDEFMADRMGVVIATRAGYDPYAMLAVLQMLESLKPEDNSSMALWFKTHPRALDRLERLDTLAARYLENYAGQSQVGERFQRQMALGRPLE
jgi:predicted Zn-dependent protease